MDQTITTKVYLDARFLDKHYKEHIAKKLADGITERCDQENGYILGISQDIEIIDNTISSSGSGTFFTVKYSIKSLKPVEGDIFKGKVCMIFTNGIFVEVEGRMKVLIPAAKMNRYKYSKSKSLFKKGSSTISEGDEVKIELDIIKYEKQNFNCIGSLKTA